MTAKVIGAYKNRVQEFKLIPATGGCFELSANGEQLYSKLATGKFPDEFAILDLLDAKMKAKS